MTKKDSKKTKEIIDKYEMIEAAHDSYIKNPHDIKAVKLLSAVEGTPQEELITGGPVSLGLGILEERQKFLGELQKNVSYGDLLTSEEDPLEIIKKLPPLELEKEKYKKLAEAHTKYYVVTKIEEESPTKKRQFVAQYMKNTGKESKYLRAWEASDINALLIGIKLEAERQLKEAIDKYKK